MANDDPKWDELEQRLREMAVVWYSARAEKDELILSLTNRAEDEWPSIVGDTE